MLFKINLFVSSFPEPQNVMSWYHSARGLPSQPEGWAWHHRGPSGGPGLPAPPAAQSLGGGTHLRCVRKLPLTCPEPSQPGVGQDMPSVFTDFQENWEPLRYPSFCLLAAKGHPDALRWEAYLPVMWPWPSHPGTGHLGDRGAGLAVSPPYAWWPPARSS